MLRSWKPPSYSSADVADFVIADDEEENVASTQTSNPAPASDPDPDPSKNSTLGFTNYFLNFTPKVDFSNTFVPFTSGIAQNATVLERQYCGSDTLDEPIWKTLKRDLSQIGRRLAIVIWPMQLQKLARMQQRQLVELAAANGIRVPNLIQMNHAESLANTFDIDTEAANQGTDKVEILEWDLWGPLVFSLVLSAALGLSASNGQTNSVFSGSFCFTWMSFLILGINTQLLGGNISFLSAISATGYSMFPLVLGELISWLVVKNKFVRLIIMLVLNAWSIFAGVMSLRCSGVLPGKVLLAVYPVGLMYSVISWLVIIT